MINETREVFEKIQWKKLKKQLVYCYKNSPFYQNKMKNYGIEPGDIKSYKDFKLFPFTKREEIYSCQQEYPPFGNLVTIGKEQWHEVHTTTGTAGKPIFVVWSAKDILNFTNFVFRSFSALGITNRDIFYNVFRYGFRMGGLTVHRVAEKFHCFAVPVGVDVLTNTGLEMFININPTVLISFPSEIIRLKDRLGLRKINPKDLALRIAILGGEPGTSVDEIRGLIERPFNLKAYDTYGITEMGPLIGTECLCQKGIHWAEDHYFVEIIDPVTGMPCQPGEMGILVLTDLTKEAMPLIRYWTNDYVALSTERCECGSVFVRTKGAILGGDKDIVSFNGRKFYIFDVQKILWSIEGGVGQEFLVILEGGGTLGQETCILQVERKNDESATEQREFAQKLKEKIEKELKIPVIIEAVPHGTINKYGGLNPKISRIIDRRKPGNILI